MLEKGFVHLYTGNGKGKTTAALGLAVRAAGAGLRTVMIQFMKGQHYSELDALKMYSDMIRIEQYGSPEFCRLDNEKSVQEHYRLARDAMARSREVIVDDAVDLIILDEIITAYLFKLVTLDEIKALIKDKPLRKELVLTGRGAPEALYEYCDLITEMREIKHYYQQGVQARTGIES
jgi:cob(I)alamin adenosyltransferase